MRSVLLALALVGCGGGGGSGSEPLLLQAAHSKLAAVHDGATWRPLTLDAQGTAKVALDGPTLIATVCDNPGFFNYYTIGVGPGEQDLDMSCADTVPVATLQVAAPATTFVSVGFSRTVGGRSFAVQHGTYDIVAVDTSLTPARIEVRRGVSITSDATLTFDLATAGVAMTKLRVDVTGAAAAETPTRRSTLRTASGTFSTWLATAGDAWIPPPSVVGPGDRVSVGASTSTEERAFRSVRRDLAGAETTVTLALPPYVTSALPSPLDASIAWQGDARYDSAYFGVNTPDFARLWDTLLMPSWQEAGGETSTIAIPDPSTIPGWQSAWDLAITPGFDWVFFAQHDDGADHVDASLDGMF